MIDRKVHLSQVGEGKYRIGKVKYIYKNRLMMFGNGKYRYYVYNGIAVNKGIAKSTY